MELISEPAQCESGSSIVQNVALQNHTNILTHELKVVFCIDGLVCVEMGLKLDVNETRCVIHKETNT